MVPAYVVVTVLAAAANLVAAGLDFVRYPQVLRNMAKLGVPEAWLMPLGLLKAAGALGLLVGIVIPPIGIAAAVGLILFFVGAILTHVRARDYALTTPLSFLALAVAALVLRLAVAAAAGTARLPRPWRLSSSGSVPNRARRGFATPSGVMPGASS